jgi:Domain of unknown function, B. Theta Gene description (DUF3871)
MSVQLLTQPVATTQPHTNSNFLTTANSMEMTLADIREGHIIPVFSRDNMPTVSQAEFIQEALRHGDNIFGNHSSLDIKTSHPIKGRTFEARHKQAKELLQHEQTLYYERMTFLAQYPIVHNVNGQELHLTVGGVKAYNVDNLNTVHDRTDQRFQIAVGFKVNVCTNLCINTTGARLDIRVRSAEELSQKIQELLSTYNADQHIEQMREMQSYKLTEQQFANIIGRARIQQYLPPAQLKEIPELLISDSQLNSVSRAYLRDKNFPKDESGINMWNFYNLLTDSVKTSYIDNFLERQVNAHELTTGLITALSGDADSKYNWFLN